MRNRQLHSALSAFAEEAAWQLSAETAQGAEVPFEVVEAGGAGRWRDTPLYCYRPLTAEFIAARVGVLGRLPSYVPAAHALSGAGGLDDYLERRGERPPASARERADAALLAFLGRVFEESTDFVLNAARLDRAFRELEEALYEGATETVVIAPLLGLDLVSEDVALGDGLALVRGDAFAGDAPAEALWARGADRPHVLAVLRWEEAAGDPAPVAHARVRLGRLLTALRLFDAAPVAYGPLAWTSCGGGPWQPFALGATGQPETALEIVPEQEDELRAFCSLVARRTPRAGELAWALARFELACERATPAQALTDHLLALRALLEPEGPGSGRLPGRLAALCALPEHQARLAERIAHTASLERAVVAGLAVDPALDRLVAELAAHLRALLRDVLCGHLDSDLRTVADEILADGSGQEQPTAA
jgi:hypothetical protein